MGVKLKNNSNSLIDGNLSYASTQLFLVSGTGHMFPELGEGDYFYATLIAPTGFMEIVKCTRRVNDTLTIVRGQENTNPKDFPTGSRIELRVTAQSVLDAIEDRVELFRSSTEYSFFGIVGQTRFNVTYDQSQFVEVFFNGRKLVEDTDFVRAENAVDLTAPIEISGSSVVVVIHSTVPLTSLGTSEDFEVGMGTSAPITDSEIANAISRLDNLGSINDFEQSLGD